MRNVDGIMGNDRVAREVAEATLVGEDGDDIEEAAVVALPFWLIRAGGGRVVKVRWRVVELMFVWWVVVKGVVEGSGKVANGGREVRLVMGEKIKTSLDKILYGLRRIVVEVVDAIEDEISREGEADQRVGVKEMEVGVEKKEVMGE